MSEQRRNQILEQFRRPPNGYKSSRSKDIKVKLHHLRSKETFLTDTQTSDYTKSSAEINYCKNQQLEQAVKKLQTENSDLKQRIVQLKTSQFFQINQEKIKVYIKENQKLRSDLQNSKKELEQSLIQRDFLERFNRNLKSQCETLTKQILVLKSGVGVNETKRPQKSIYTSRDESQGNKSRNSSSDVFSGSKKKEFLLWKKQKEQNNGSQSQNLLKNSVSASKLHEDYYGGKPSRHKNNRNY